MQGQAGGKGLPATVTVQQLQQIVKSVAGGGQGQPTQQVTEALTWHLTHIRSSILVFADHLTRGARQARSSGSNCPSASPSRVWRHRKAGSTDHSGADKGTPFALF